MLEVLVVLVAPTAACCLHPTRPYFSTSSLSDTVKARWLSAIDSVLALILWVGLERHLNRSYIGSSPHDSIRVGIKVMSSPLVVRGLRRSLVVMLARLCCVFVVSGCHLISQFGTIFQDFPGVKVQVSISLGLGSGLCVPSQYDPQHRRWVRVHGPQ